MSDEVSKTGLHRTGHRATILGWFGAAGSHEPRSGKECTPAFTTLLALEAFGGRPFRFIARQLVVVVITLRLFLALECCALLQTTTVRTVVRP